VWQLYAWAEQLQAYPLAQSITRVLATLRAAPVKLFGLFRFS